MDAIRVIWIGTTGVCLELGRRGTRLSVRRQNIPPGLVARYVMEKSLESKFPGISFRDSLSGREAYLTGYRVAVWELVDVHEEFQSIAATVEHFHWPVVLVQRALAYASEFPEEIKQSREGERHGVPVVS